MGFKSKYSLQLSTQHLMNIFIDFFATELKVGNKGFLWNGGLLVLYDNETPGLRAAFKKRLLLC